MIADIHPIPAGCEIPGRSLAELGLAQRCAGVHRLFEAQTERAPGAPALVCREQQWSYRTLDGHAAALAGELRCAGVAPGTLVGICAGRSCALGAAVLAALKAGAAYVPLDPELPAERLRSMVADCRPAAVLADLASSARAQAWGAPVVPIECLAAAPENASGAPRGAEDSESDDPLAYVIYTSGTTGKPKGVMIGQRALLNHCRAIAQLYRLGPGDRVLQFASLGFDVAAEEMFPAWSAGATVVIWPAPCALAPIRTFVQFIAAAEITVVNLPAPYWHEWVAEIDRVGVPRSIRLVVVGSDAVLAEKAAVWQARTRGRVRLVNAYGATETTITATTYEVPSLPEPRGALPIGRPISGVTAHVLDAERRPVAAGVAGELYLGGACVASGYLHPAEDAVRFCDDPLASEPDARLYRSGDQVRRRADGNLEFLGRCDDQIKVRGCRVEIAEIEALLRRHEKIRSAVVIGRLEAPASRHLVAYIVGRAGPPPQARELRAYLRAHLPHYMVPRWFVPLRRMPLTAGGKLDRARLPEARTASQGRHSDYLAPRSMLEAELARLWEGLLETRPIGVRDDFFELGGDSLGLVRLAAQIEQRLKLNVAITALLQARTIEALARLLASKRQARPGALIWPCRVHGARAPLFCHGGSDDLARLLGADQPLYWLDPHGMNGGRIPDTIEDMAGEYLDELTAIQPRGPYSLLGYSFGGLVVLELARLLIGRGEEVGLLILVDPSAPPDLEEPVWRAPVEAERGRRWHGWRRAALDGFCRSVLALGGRVPPRLRLSHFARGADRALQRYRASAYPGSFLLFRRPDNLSAARWRALALGPVEIYESWIDHNDFLEAPHVEPICRRIESHFQPPGGSTAMDPADSPTQH